MTKKKSKTQKGTRTEKALVPKKKGEKKKPDQAKREPPKRGLLTRKSLPQNKEVFTQSGRAEQPLLEEKRSGQKIDWGFAIRNRHNTDQGGVIPHLQPATTYVTNNPCFQDRIGLENRPPPPHHPKETPKKPRTQTSVHATTKEKTRGG